MSEIFLNDILNIPEEEIINYKIKFNMNNGEEEPLNVMNRNMNEFLGWVAWRSGSDDLSRKYVIALVRYYTVSADQWVFAGTYKVSKKENYNEITNGVAYDLEAVKEHEKYVGKLIVEYKNSTIQIKRYAENCINEIRVVEILKKPYEGVPFCGYNKINLSFQELEVIVNKNIDEWKRKLENITGIYMLFDRSTGKKYIGSAYGQEGIWQRWSYYIYSKHGGNKELLQLPIEYIRENFNFSLLEWHKIGEDKDFIISRENYWKDVLMSREKEYGYNDN